MAPNLLSATRAAFDHFTHEANDWITQVLQWLLVPATACCLSCLARFCYWGLEASEEEARPAAARPEART